MHRCSSSRDQGIEELLTTFKESSQTNAINENAGIQPVKVDKEVFDLIFPLIENFRPDAGCF